MRPRARRARRPAPPIVTDPVESAKAAGLRYVCGGPGLRRRRAGTGFSYVDPEARRVTDRDELRRIRSLAIPPAWRDVWISPSSGGHIQAVGRDARGRKQYRYHPRWRELRDATKYTRMIAFAEALPTIRALVERDLALPGLPREKILASVVRLLETTRIRVGNAEYAKANGSFGLTTLRNRHVDVSGSTVRFDFRGKGGKPVGVGVTDRRVARVIARCQELPGQELFQCLDGEGARQTINSADVNAYLKDLSGQDFTAKDFRTWAGTVGAAQALGERPAFASNREARRNVVRAIESVARQLGNTPAICRKSYVHPAVVDAYFDGRVIAAPAAPANGLRSEEAAVLALLRGRLPREPAARRAA